MCGCKKIATQEQIEFLLKQAEQEFNFEQGDYLCYVGTSIAKTTYRGMQTQTYYSISKTTNTCMEITDSPPNGLFGYGHIHPLEVEPLLNKYIAHQGGYVYKILKQEDVVEQVTPSLTPVFTKNSHEVIVEEVIADTGSKFEEAIGEAAAAGIIAGIDENTSFATIEADLDEDDSLEIPSIEFNDVMDVPSIEDLETEILTATIEDEEIPTTELDYSSEIDISTMTTKQVSNAISGWSKEVIAQFIADEIGNKNRQSVLKVLRNN